MYDDKSDKKKKNEKKTYKHKIINYYRQEEMPSHLRVLESFGLLNQWRQF